MKFDKYGRGTYTTRHLGQNWETSPTHYEHISPRLDAPVYFVRRKRGGTNFRTQFAGRYFYRDRIGDLADVLGIMRL